MHFGLGKTMHTVTLQLSADTERKLRDQAGQLGQTLERYLQQIAEKALKNGPIPSPSQRDAIRNTPVAAELEEFPKFIARPRLTADEVDNLLDQLSAGSAGKVLQADFSRADIYDDRD